MEQKEREFVERRKGPDLLVRLVHWLGSIAWIIMFFILGITDRAKPQTATFFDRFFKVQVRETWNYSLVQWAFYLMILLSILCLIGLIANACRHRRKSDRYSFSLIMMFILAVVGIMMYLASF